VPLIAGDHVTDDAGTGFVHTAPGHGREDFEAWMDAAAISRRAASRPPSPSPSMMPAITPRTPPASDRTAKAAPARVIDDKGKKGDANQAVITR
jgi:isoleucyl-tRNA synthetase